ncbi:NfeD family protein [Marinomonas sp. PE14-40]|uniref:NfeD family protein n=1 Tax=Marinomonas sp. PE14-40 TaxID=3060621 RepID=UPI003F67753A
MLEYLAQGFIILGIILITVEVLVLGLSTFVLLFAGVAMILSGSLMVFELIETSWIWAFSSTTAITFLLSVLFWKPLKAMQNKVEVSESKTEFNDKEFVLEQNVDIKGESQYQYSGIMWQLKSQHEISKGTLVKVDKIEVGVLWVSEVD